MTRQISVVIPTYNRRMLLEQCLESLCRQTAPLDSFEVIVAVDGSTDDTVDFVKDFSPPYAFKYFAQENKGLPATRNNGARLAATDFLIFIDDDIIAGPELVEEHLASLRQAGNALVQGGLSVHPQVRRTPFIQEEEAHLQAFMQGKKYHEPLAGEDISGGNVSISRDLFFKIGGFNSEVRWNEDGEFGHRLEKENIPILYNKKALGLMADVRDLDVALRASYAYGKSYVQIQRLHPESIWKFSPMVNDRNSLLRNLARRFLYFKQQDTWRLGSLEKTFTTVIRLAEKAGATPVTRVLYRLALDYYFWKGVFAAAGDLRKFRPGSIPVLCYHNVSDIRNCAFRLYIMPIKRFSRQMRWLEEKGYETITLNTLYDYLDHGGPLPKKPVVITFDDGYRELKENATPILAGLNFHHVLFINTGKMGLTTDWVERAPDIPLLSRGEISAMVDRYGDILDFQAHGKTHLSMKGAEPETIVEEVRDCIDVLEPITGRPVQYLAYPYGERDGNTPDIIRSLGLRCSFTVDQGLCRPGQDLHLLPRVEIFGNDFFIDFILNARWGWSPIARLRTRLKRRYKKIIRLIKR